MSINGIGNNYYYNASGTQRAGLPFSTPFTMPLNPVFDEVIFPMKTGNTAKADNIETGQDKIKVIAHRGYTETAPENTIPAFVAAAKNGYNTIECDVEWTKDGVPVILHDSTINRTARASNGWRFILPRKCSKLTYDKLLKYDFGSWYSNDFKGTKIPTFDEVLNCACDYDLNLYIELKETENFDSVKAEKLAGAVKEAGLEDKVTWISFNSDYLKAMSNVMPEARLGYLSKNKADKSTVETLKNLQTGKNEVFLDIKASKISENSSKLLKQAGFSFEAWGVDETDTLQDLESFGCKGITTDKITENDIKEYYAS